MTYMVVTELSWLHFIPITQYFNHSANSSVSPQLVKGHESLLMSLYLWRRWGIGLHHLLNIISEVTWYESGRAMHSSQSHYTSYHLPSISIRCAHWIAELHRIFLLKNTFYWGLQPMYRVKDNRQIEKRHMAPHTQHCNNKILKIPRA